MSVPKEIWINLNAPWDGTINPVHGTGTLSHFVRADLAQAPAPVRVKPLVWEAFGKECLRAETVLGRYEIMWGFHNGQTSLDVLSPRRTHTWHTTPETAKAAAQADYEASVLAALEPAPDLAELVDALRSNLVFAETIIEATDIDPEETALSVRVMPEGREVARRTWAEVLNETRTLIAKLETRA